MKNHKYLYLITLAFFGLSFVNIHFAILGVICMTIPMVLLQRDKIKNLVSGILSKIESVHDLRKKEKEERQGYPHVLH